jgi:hypothetical protein
MKIIIELDSSNDQVTEVKKLSTQVAEQKPSVDSAVGSFASAIDAGQPRVQDAYRTEVQSSNGTQLLQGSTPSSATGALDGGAAQIQDDAIRASATPDTGKMETYNTSSSFSGGSFADRSHN